MNDQRRGPTKLIRLEVVAVEYPLEAEVRYRWVDLLEMQQLPGQDNTGHIVAAV